MPLAVSIEIQKPYASHQKYDLALDPLVSLELSFSHVNGRPGDAQIAQERLWHGLK